MENPSDVHYGVRRTKVQDPEWAEMRDASRADGPIVTNVESMFLNPTDFSPAR